MPSGDRTTSGYLLGQVLIVATEVFGFPVSESDNFFDLYGDSVHAMELIARLQQRLGVEAEVDALLEAEDFADFTRTIAGS